MIGSMFRRGRTSPGDVVLYQGRSYKAYRGMGSIGAMKRGSKERYFQGEVREEKNSVPEGIEGRVPHRGSLRDILYQMIGGLPLDGILRLRDDRAACREGQIRQISSAGLRESHVHDVIITKEAPNYSME